MNAVSNTTAQAGMSPDFGRRNLLAGTAGAALALAMPKSAHSAPAEISDELQALIADHSAKLALWETTIDPAEDARNVWDAYVKSGAMPMIRIAGGAISTTDFPLREDAVSQVMQIFQRSREGIRALKPISAGMSQTLLGEIEQQQAAALGEVARVFDEIETGAEFRAMAAADARYEALCEAEREALVELCGFVCNSLEDERARAAYILTQQVITEGVVMNDEVAVWLLRSIAGEVTEDEVAA